LCAGYEYIWKNLDLDIEWIWNSTSLIHEIPFACGCCMAISKKIFQDVGEFDLILDSFHGEKRIQNFL
jgi:GT2 family glycosyltransferase